MILTITSNKLWQHKKVLYPNGIERNYYDSKGIQVKQIANNNHNLPKYHPFGKYGEHAHDYVYDKEGKVIGRSVRELSDIERKENTDIL